MPWLQRWRTDPRQSRRRRPPGARTIVRFSRSGQGRRYQAVLDWPASLLEAKDKRNRPFATTRGGFFAGGGSVCPERRLDRRAVGLSVWSSRSCIYTALRWARSLLNADVVGMAAFVFLLYGPRHLLVVSLLFASVCACVVISAPRARTAVVAPFLFVG